jgi:Family of unknown function (DUF6074)
MTEITADQRAAWLNRVHADQGLTARQFRIAFAAAQSADAQGFIGPSALAKIARANVADDATEPFADALRHLAVRGHLQACGKRRKIDGFRMVTGMTAAVQKTATITPFPAARRSAFIRKHAERLATLTPTHADADLRHQLKIQADTMRRRGVAENVVVREIRSLESSIRAELWRVVLLPDQPSGPA